MIGLASNLAATASTGWTATTLWKFALAACSATDTSVTQPGVSNRCELERGLLLRPHVESVVLLQDRPSQQPSSDYFH